MTEQPGASLTPTSGASPLRTFLVASTAFVFLYVAGGVPSPIYSIYQREWRLSGVVTTGLFAVYAVALLVALVLTGQLSDRVGRRPVVVVSLLGNALAMVVLAVAPNVGTVIAGRFVQGAATGAATAALGGLLADLRAPDGRRHGSIVTSLGSPAGLGLGALAAGAAVEYAPWPSRTSFVALTVAMLVLAGAARCALPAPRAVTPFSVRLLTPRVEVAPAARRMFGSLAPANASVWALGGLYNALGPTIATVVLGVHSHLGAAAVTAVFNLAAAAAGAGFHRVPAARMIDVGCGLLVLGTAVGVLAVRTDSYGTLLVGAAIAGSGFGPVFAGMVHEVTAATPPSRQAQGVAAIFVVSYLATSVPVVAAGLVEGHASLTSIFEVYAALVAVAAMVALVLYHRTNRHP